MSVFYLKKNDYTYQISSKLPLKNTYIINTEMSIHKNIHNSIVIIEKKLKMT